jgi:hypothetical protein
MLSSLSPMVSATAASCASPLTTSFVTQLPSPLGGLTISAQPATPSCTASYLARVPIHCRGTYDLTTTITQTVPCLGCAALTGVTSALDGCPMGGPPPSNSTTSTSKTLLTSTRVILTCSPTSGPSLSYPPPCPSSTMTTLFNLPFPYEFAEATGLETPTPSCVATYSVGRKECSASLPLFAATTTIPYYVPCLGCSLLSVSMASAPCNLNVPTMTSSQHGQAGPRRTLTEFSIQCSPTPDPMATLRSTYTDQYLNPYPGASPTAFGSFGLDELSVTKYAAGFCDVNVNLLATAIYSSYESYTGTDRADWYSTVSSHACIESWTAPTTYPKTATQTVAVDCAGCTYVPFLNAYEVDAISCGPHTGADARPLVTATVPMTTYTLACATSAANA